MGQAGISKSAVLAFFKERGKGYQKLINAILRKYMEVKKTSEYPSR
jgi:uncharacterized protein (DUF4415 family)